MMRADYDSQADALDIQLFRFDLYEHQEEVDDDYCRVGFAKGRPADVELLSPAEHLDLLEVAAERFDLDAAALVAAARAALSAPDRIVELRVGAQLVA
jgi:hypothetical protein